MKNVNFTLLKIVGKLNKVQLEENCPKHPRLPMYSKYRLFEQKEDF